MGFASSLATFAWASTAITGIPGAHSAKADRALPSDAVPSISSSSLSSSADAQPELLLMDVMYDQLRVDSALSVLQDRQGHRYVPVRQFASTLGFRLHVDTAKRSAVGFLNSPSERFDLDGIRGTCKLGKKSVRFDPNLCFVRDGDLYLECNQFATLANLHLLWQMNLLQLEVSSATPLNVEKQWIQRSRDQLAQMLLKAKLNYHPVSIPYKLWSVPSIDAQLYAAGDTGNSGSATTSSLSVTGGGDLLMMSARYRVMSDAQGQPTTLMSLGRFDPNALLLGKMRATSFEFGDLYLPPTPLLARGRNAMGLTVSNFPLPGQEVKERGELLGKSLPGSQVEVYAHDQLLGTGHCDDKGLYRLEALPYNYGPNDLQIVSVTPDGDVSEQSRRVYGGNDGPALNESRYRVTAGKIGSSVYGSDVYGAIQNQDSSELLSEFQRGLGNGAWASAMAGTTDGPQGFEKELGLGLHSWLGPFLWNANSMVSLDGGTAVSTGVSRMIGSAHVTLERTQAAGPLATRILPEIGATGTGLTSLSLDGNTGKHGQRISYGLDIDRLEGASPTSILRARMTTGDSHLLFSNSLSMRSSPGLHETSGFAQIRKPFGTSVGLLDFGYGLGGSPLIQLARATLSHSINSTYSMRYGFEYAQDRSQPLGALATIYRAMGPLDVGVNLEVLQGGRVTASLMFSTGLQGEGVRGPLALARPGAGESGSVAVRAFVDKHQTGKYEPDDPLIPDVSFLINEHPRSIHTDKSGRAVLDQLPPNQEVSVSADEDSFENPSWVSENLGVTIIPRPGRAVAVDFPVLEASELEGKLVMPTGAALPPGLTADLIDSNNKVSDNSILDASGTYVFSRIRPGSYSIRLIDLSNKTFAQREITIAPGAVLKAVNIDAPSTSTAKLLP